MTSFLNSRFRFGAGRDDDDDDDDDDDEALDRLFRLRCSFCVPLCILRFSPFPRLSGLSPLVKLSWGRDVDDDDDSLAE